LSDGVACGLAAFEQRGTRERRKDAEPQAHDAAPATTYSGTAYLIAEQLPHVLPESLAEVWRKEANEGGEDSFRKRRSRPGDHVAHRWTSAFTDGEVTSAWSRAISAASTRPPSGVIL